MTSREPESTGETLSSYETDAALSHANDDRLDRAPFVARMVDLLARPTKESLVVGLYGRWGEGKSSVLNFVAEELARRDDIVVLRFNPWLFPAEPVLLASFFNEMGAALGKQLVRKHERVLGSLSDYASAVSTVGLPGAAAEKALKKLGEVKPTELRERFARALAESHKQLVVFLDDIDRLDRSEVQSVFRLVKLVADFPRTAYVLAFDEVAVASALAERYPDGAAGGSNFLEKIVQVPLHLPKPRTDSLLSMAADYLQAALQEYALELTEDDTNRLGAYFAPAFIAGLTSVRTVKRFANSLRFSLGGLKGVVNTADLILLEGLRTIYPRVYESIRDNPGAYLGHLLRRDPNGSGKSRTGAILSEATSGLTPEQAEAAETLILHLFPRMQALRQNITWSSEWDRTWASAKLVCSEEYLPRYFSYGLRSSDISDVAVDRFLELLDGDHDAATPEAAEREVLAGDLLAPDTADRFVMHLRKTEPKVSAPAAEALLVLLAAAAPHFTDNGRGGLSIATNPFDQAALLMVQLLKLLGAEQRREIAHAIASKMEPLAFAVEFVQWLRPTDSESAEGLTAEEVTGLARLVADRVAAAAEGPPATPVIDLDPRRPIRLVQMWSYSGDAEACRAHLTEEVSKDPEVLRRLVDAVVPASFDPYTGERRRSSFRPETYEFLLEVIDPDVALTAFSSLSGRDLSMAPPEDLELDSLPRAEQYAVRFSQIHYARKAQAADQAAADAESSPNDS
jgi:hypothetical protein